ncbi:uncharacterized protein LOC125138464 [Tachysurus fulvidraco]|uniref:uncharacterized protein LOC125138464 n=1 Tax=Tachysurus fulvidraco TaxID=1234273 RepID=UPI001FEDA375|nr:uncharacterized protein LOC125138464 [Tachysurus fulvidraco]
MNKTFINQSLIVSSKARQEDAESQEQSRHVNDFDEPVSLISADLGHAVTLHCTMVVKSNMDLIVWYKQKPGRIPQGIGMIGVAIGEIILPPFNETVYQLTKTGNITSLNILHVTKDDEAMYICGASRVNVIEFSSGIFLSVRDKPHLGISVWQRGVSDSVPAGASVTLQCSVLSESRAAELQVLWFRAAPPQSHPQIIYTHHNSSHQCESDSSTHTCVYNFSKNILSLNDTGTYYCAVLLCGKIIFGNGTPIQMEKSTDPVVIYLAVALGVCLLVIVAHIATCKGRNCECFTGKSQECKVKKTENKSRDAGELNYVASLINKKTGKTERAHDNIYTEVIYSSVS